MKIEKEKNSSPIYLKETIAGLFLTLWGLYKIVTNSPINFHGVPSPTWVGWVVAPVGLHMLVGALKGTWRNKQEAKKEAEAAILEELEREVQGDVASNAGESESKKEDSPQGGA